MKFRLTPIMIIVVGILLSVAVFLLLLSEPKHVHFVGSLMIASPWDALVSGIVISILIALSLHLVYKNREHKIALEILNENFKKEIVDRIQAEQSKSELEKALLEGQKLQAIGRLAGGIAHDFNNILYAVNGYTEMAREDVPKDSLTYQNLGKVIEASHRGQDLISRILAFSRRHHPEFSLIPLKATIESALSLLRPTIPASVDIQFTAELHNCMIMGNQTQLHQVIVNIINNAVDAMDGEGTIKIHIGHIFEKDPIFKRFHDMNKGIYCKITITDTGCGMGSNTLTRIFEPFFTTKEVGKGTGLGLSTVHAIIEEHKGKIMATSKLGQGTTFTILLPEA